MSRFGETLPLYAAENAAAALCELLAPVCDRIEIAGSIIRRAALVGDIELVAIPAFADGRRVGQLFGTGQIDQLDQALTLLRDEGVQNGGDLYPLHHFGRSGAWGPKQKQFAYRHGRRWFPVDLYAVTREAWGCQLAIRTGPADFSRLLVTHRSKGGALPDGWTWKGGRLFDADQMLLDTPEENDVFHALGLPAWEPHQRTASQLKSQLLKEGFRHACPQT